MEILLLTIEGCLAVGFFAGLIIGFLITKQKVGCVVLLAVPVSMAAFISWWQGQHPENLTSTSSLDFLFGPLWPSLGAVAGYYVGRFVRSR
jgi:hypothetical protein